MDTTSVGALAAIDELRIDSKIGKSKHFNASDRKMFWHRFYGVPVIVANLFVGIVLVSLQGTSTEGGTQGGRSAQVAAPATPKEAPPGTVAVQDVSDVPADERFVRNADLLRMFSIFLAFGAASLSGIQTFFNFLKTAEGHRSIGNRYVHISRQCKGLQQKNRDVPFSPIELWKEYEKLYTDYHQINTEAEAFPTNAKDLRDARTAPEISPYKAPDKGL